MEEGNRSEVTEFILSGLTDRPELQLPLFGMFLLIYVTTLVGNGGMILLTTFDQRLHTPMYFFLRSLSFCDLCYSTVIVPKLLLDFLVERKSISYTACALQIYLLVSFSDTECLLLAVMAYDRYVAICNPLLYTVTMSRQRCHLLVSEVCVVGFMDALLQTCCAFILPFCSSNVIDHFCCDIPPVLVLSCSDTHTNELLMFASMCYIVVTSLATILLSYVCIISTILQISSAEGRRKTFSTCTCHLITVGMFHGSQLFLYLRPSTSYSLTMDKMALVFYTVMIPFLNPLIYSLRNREVKDALRKVVTKLLSHP